MKITRTEHFDIQRKIVANMTTYKNYRVQFLSIFLQFLHNQSLQYGFEI